MAALAWSALAASVITPIVTSLIGRPKTPNRTPPQTQSEIKKRAKASKRRDKNRYLHPIAPHIERGTSSYKRFNKPTFRKYKNQDLRF